MSLDDQDGPVDADDLADEIWEDESPAAVIDRPSPADAPAETPGRS